MRRDDFRSLRNELIYGETGGRNGVLEEEEVKGL